MVNFDIKWKKGDTADQIEFSIEINGSLLDLSQWSIKMDIRKSGRPNRVEKTLTVGNGIVMDGNYSFLVGGFIVDITPGNYVYDIQLTNGPVIKTYVKGNLIVKQDITDA